MAEPELVHPIPVEEAERWQRTLYTALLADIHGDEARASAARQRSMWDPARTWGFRDRGQWVATLATRQRVLTVPGLGTATRDLTADALTGVSTAATHRRRGMLTAMLTRSLRAARERGDAVSILIAAEWPIYGRFGYAPATTNVRYRLRSRKSGGVSGADRTSVRGLASGELGALAPDVFDRARRGRPGQVDRDDGWWQRLLHHEGEQVAPLEHANWVAHEGQDGVDGMLSWKPTRDLKLSGTLGAIEVPEFFAATDAAYRDLWGYLAALDAVDEVELSDRSVDEPVRWLLADGRALETLRQNDEVWVRLLDVPAALTARRYAVAGRVVLDVRDDLAAGRFELNAQGDTVTCTPSTSPPELELDQRALAAIYLGGHRLHEVASTGWVREHRPGTLALIDLMFSTPLPPWSQTGF